ncbi:MAG TPA: hypothetical protein VN695_17280 [Streptosporangiaceae bacterium]|nr:hypothetical protein [Streptosporangiaceae bacterium]
MTGTFPPPDSPPDVDLGRVWIGVVGEVWRRRPGLLERSAAALLRSPGLARALLTTPSLLVPWLIASVAVLGAGAAATFGTGQPIVALMAPAVAAAGIGYAYGPGIDPAWELAASMAISDRIVLLVRALVVFAVYALLGLAASAASGVAAVLTVGWLIPMTLVSALALAAAMVARSANVGVATGLSGWTIMVLSWRAADGRFTAAVTYTAPRAALYLALAACCGIAAAFAPRVRKGTP